VAKQPELIGDIIETYLNRSAILTLLKRHDKSVETLYKALAHIEKSEKYSNTKAERL
jgi:hypothetical protein